MLTRDTVEGIVNCRLAEPDILRHLSELIDDKVDAEMIGLFVEVLRESLHPDAAALCQYADVLDPSGTGGSGRPHFNTSTTVAFVLAAAGIKVAKFGNRASQSTSGSFDLLEVLGVPANIPALAVPDLLDEVGLAFLFAPAYYPGLAKLAPLRKSIKARTIFNSLGPLLNPIRPEYRVMGVSCQFAQRAAGQYLSQEERTRRALVVRSHSGLDELEPYGDNLILESMSGLVREIHLRDFPSASIDTAARDNGTGSLTRLKSMRESAAKLFFSPQENFKLFNETINGSGPTWIADIVCLNAAAGLVASGRSNFEDGYKVAKTLIESGAVAQKVAQCRRAYGQITA